MTENEFEQAQKLEETDRLRGLAAIRDALDAPGTAACTDCTARIPKERKLAVPNATRCTKCQTIHEKAARHGR